MKVNGVIIFNNIRFRNRNAILYNFIPIKLSPHSHPTIASKPQPMNLSRKSI